MSCPYKDLLGKIGEGVHSYRIANIAIADVIFTIMGAFILHFLFPMVRTIYFLVGLFILGIALHRIFCVRTTIDRLLF